MSTVEKLSEKPTPINKSINARPVTISAFSIGILVTLIITDLDSFFIRFTVRHAKVPRNVAISEATSARKIVFLRAFSILSFSKSCLYHFSVNPFHVPRSLESLKDDIINNELAVEKLRLQIKELEKEIRNAENKEVLR